MRTYSRIIGRSLRITGGPQSGWRAATADGVGTKLVPFDLAVTDDGSGEFLLRFRSRDGAYEGDSCHESLEDAYASAERQFGIPRLEWVAP